MNERETACLVQILVVVASIQMRLLKTEVEKGSMRRGFRHGSVGPERVVTSVGGVSFWGFLTESFSQARQHAKGNGVNIPRPGRVFYYSLQSGNARRGNRDIGRQSGESFLFLLTVLIFGFLVVGWGAGGLRRPNPPGKRKPTRFPESVSYGAGDPVTGIAPHV